MKAATAKGAAARGKVLSKAIQALGAPTGGRLLLVGADASLAKTVGTDFSAIEIIKADMDSLGQQTHSAFDLIIVVRDIEVGGIGQVRQVLQAAIACLAPGASLVLYLATFAAPAMTSGTEGPVQPYDPLLFPEAAAVGDMGEDLRRHTPLAASTWFLLLRSLGLEVTGQAGVGEHRLPTTLVQDHQARLAVFDPLELGTGRLLLILRVAEEAAR